MKLSKWAKDKGITYCTALRWYHKGLIENSRQLETGTILVEPDSVKIKKQLRVCAYARVSSYERKACLDGQLERCVAFASAIGLSVDKTYKEIASGMNDNRRMFWNMIESSPTHIIVEHKDRLTRFGFNYLETLLQKLGCEIVVVNKDTENEADLMKDLISVITSFCCRLYGLRRGSKKAKKIKMELAKPDGNTENND